MQWRRDPARLPLALAALGAPEASSAVQALVRFLGPTPAEVRERRVGVPVRRVRQLVFDGGSEIHLHDDAVARICLALDPDGRAPRSRRLRTWIPGARKDASLEDLEEALDVTARTFPQVSAYLPVEGGYLQPRFEGGAASMLRGRLRRLTLTVRNPGPDPLPLDQDCSVCDPLLVRAQDGSAELDLVATVDVLSAALSAGLLTEVPDRVPVADLRPLHRSGLMEVVESQVICLTCRRALCITLRHDAATTADRYASSQAAMRRWEPIPPVERWGDAARVLRGRDELRCLDHAPGAWFLLGALDDLFLEARYTSGALFDGSVLVRLDERERSAYLAGGHDYLAQLATTIHESSPSLPTSPYRSRDLYRGPDRSRFRQEVGRAIAGRTWLAEQRRTAVETPRRGR